MVYIKDVTPAVSRWSVKVIVHEKTQPRVSQAGGCRHQHVVFMDETGQKVMAVMYEEDIDRLKDDFRVSSTYTISNARLKRIEDKYNKFNYPYQWTINRQTVYNEERTDAIPCSTIKRDFVALNDIQKKIGPNALIDILGIVIRKKNIRNFSSDIRKHTLRDFAIMNEKKNVVVLTLWNTVAVSEGKIIDDAIQAFPIITATALIYSPFYGGSLGSTAGTVITVDPLIPEAQNLATWRSNNMKTIVETIGAKNYFFRDDSSTPFPTGPCSTVADVAANDKADKFMIKASVKIIEANQKFYYMGCEKCYSGIDAEHNYAYSCNSCREATIAKPRAKLLANIYDSTGSLDITFFGNQCQEIIKMDALMCMELHDAENIISINEINNDLFGKLFLIKLNRKMRTKGNIKFYQYTAVRMQPHEEIMEKNTSCVPVKEIGSSSTDISASKTGNTNDVAKVEDTA